MWRYAFFCFSCTLAGFTLAADPSIPSKDIKESSHLIDIPNETTISPRNKNLKANTLCMPPPPIYAWIYQKIHKKTSVYYAFSDNTYTEYIYPAIARNDYTTVEQWLRHGANPNHQGAGCMHSLLHTAAQQDDPRIISLLVAYGANVNQTGASKDTPMHIAAIAGKTSCLQRLYSHGAHIHARNATHSTPLILALDKKQEAAAYVLLKLGAHPNVSDAVHRKPIFQAVTWCSPSMVKTLIDYGAHVNVQAEEGNTLLHYLPQAEHPKICTILRQAGATMNTKNSHSTTPLEHTLTTILDIDDKMEAASWLIACGATLTQRLRQYPYYPEVLQATQGKLPQEEYLNSTQALRIMIGYYHNTAIIRFLSNHQKHTQHYANMCANLLEDAIALGNSNLIAMCASYEILTIKQFSRVCMLLQPNTLQQVGHMCPNRIRQDYRHMPLAHAQRILKATNLRSSLLQEQLYTQQQSHHYTDINIICP